MTAPGPYRAQLDQVIGGLRVTRENVLVVRDAIVNEAKRLQTDLDTHWWDAVTMPEFGGDPVSRDAAVAFPDRVGKLLDQCQLYVQDLLAAGQALDATALRYGLTEDSIKDSFHAVPTVTPAQPDDVIRGSSVGELIDSLTTVRGAPTASSDPVPGLLPGAPAVTSTSSGPVAR